MRKSSQRLKSQKVPVLGKIHLKMLRNCCVKSVQIRIFFWSVFSCIQTEYEDLLRKYGPEQPLYLDTSRSELKRISGIVIHHTIMATTMFLRNFAIL